MKVTLEDLEKDQNIDLKIKQIFFLHLYGSVVKKIVENIFSFISEKSLMLNVGCVSGWLSRLATETQLKVISSVDVSKKNNIININRKYVFNHEFIKDFVENLPFSDKTFDAVILTEFLEHLIDIENSLKEIKRLIKDKSKFILTTPTYSHNFIFDIFNTSNISKFLIEK